MIISFTGMCLLVPGKVAGTLDVFLINASGHFARLYIRAGNGSGTCHYGFSKPIPLSIDRDLTFLGPTSSAPIVLPPDIANITARTHQVLDPTVDAATAPNARVVARFTLPSGTVTTYHGGNWRFGASGPLAYCANWQIDNFGQKARLESELTTISGQPQQLQVTDGAYRLLVANVPYEELPCTPPTTVVIDNGQNPPHFEMYNMILTPSTPSDTPTWIGPNNTSVDMSTVCLGEDLPKPLRTALLGSFIRCMVAQASR